MRFFAFNLFLLFIYSCSTSPTGRKQLKYLPEGQLNSIGDNSFEQMKQKTPVDQSERNNRYVKCVVDHILDSNGFDANEWETVVFKDDTANAFALPGNNIGVHSGIIKIADEQSELAAVIGHEIAHVIAEHGNERMSQALGVQLLLIGAQVAMEKKQTENSNLIMAARGLGTQVGILMAYSRKHETEADILGQKYMAKAGFNPEGAVSLWRKMAKQSNGAPPEFLSTHPSHDSRIKELSKNAQKVMSYYKDVANKPNCSL